MSDDTEPRVIPFRKRDDKPVEPGAIAAPPVAAPVDGPPTDGLVLACPCGCTSMELLNAGWVVCARCHRPSPTVWGWK